MLPAQLCKEHRQEHTPRTPTRAAALLCVTPHRPSQPSALGVCVSLGSALRGPLSKQTVDGKSLRLSRGSRDPAYQCLQGILASQGLNGCGRGLPGSTHLFPDPLPQPARFRQDHRPGRAKPGVRVSGQFTRHDGLTDPEGPHAVLGEEPAPAPQSRRRGGVGVSPPHACPPRPRPQHPGWCSQPRLDLGAGRAN